MKEIVLNNVGSRIRHAIESATEFAYQSEENFRHGAVLFSGKRMISCGINKRGALRWARKAYIDIRSEKTWRKSYANIHAEINCLNNIDREMYRGKDIAVVRIHKNGRLANSRPCECCQRVLRQRGIKRIYYSIDDDYVGLLCFD